MYRVNWQNPFDRNGGALPSRHYATEAEAQNDMRQDPPLSEHCNIWDETAEPRIIASRVVHGTGRSTYYP